MACQAWAIAALRRTRELLRGGVDVEKRLRGNWRQTAVMLVRPRASGRRTHGRGNFRCPKRVEFPVMREHLRLLRVCKTLKGGLPRGLHVFLRSMKFSTATERHAISSPGLGRRGKMLPSTCRRAGLSAGDTRLIINVNSKYVHCPGPVNQDHLRILCMLMSAFVVRGTLLFSTSLKTMED